VRVAWAGSLVIDLNSPSGGIDIENITWDKKEGSQQDKYAQSKTGNMFLASEFARRTEHDGVIHVAFNPGNLKSPLQRHLPGMVNTLTVSFA
jgi:retinol dehydrogenase-12